MKTMRIYMLVFLLALGVQRAEAISPSSITLELTTGSPWAKSKSGVWVGQYKVKYKKGKTGGIASSKDGKNWKPANGGIWLDNLGKYMNREGGVVKGSPDEGKTWAVTPGGQWQGGDGHMYKFDKQLALWVQ
jgi:hypothetical protein